MLNFMDVHLQEIKYNKRLFEGVNVIAVGDQYQLKHVQDGYIFQPLQWAYGPLATNLSTEHFSFNV